MKTFEQFISDASRRGSVNLVFERGTYSLMDDLERILAVLREAKVPFEVVGGVAVNAHVDGVRRSRSFVTRDIDLLVERNDLDKIVAAAESAGYNGRRIFGGFMLIRPQQDPEEAVHLWFVGERPRSTHPTPNPPINPEEKQLPEIEVSIPVARVRELVQMKLNSFCPKDETHLEILDKCGLITPAMESELPPVLRERLAQARTRYSDEEREL